MDQSQMLSFVGSIYDKLVSDVAEKVKVLISNDIDARITAALEGAVFEAKVGNVATKVIADSEAYKAAQGEVTPIDEDKLKEMVSSYVDGAVQEAIADHCNDYDHDEMVNVTDSLSNYDLDDFITNDNLHDSVRETIDNMTFEVRVS